MVKTADERRASMADARRKMSISKAANMQGYASQMKRRASMKVEEADRVLTMDPGSQMAEAVSACCLVLPTSVLPPYRCSRDCFPPLRRHSIRFVSSSPPVRRPFWK